MTDTIVCRAASIAPTSASQDDRTVEVVWSTGAPVRRPATRGEPEHVEELVLDERACRLVALNAGAPVLAAHRRDGLDAVLGSVVPGSAVIADGAGRATIRFSRRADVDPIWQDVLDGHLRTVSIGYRRDRIDRIPPARRGEPEIWRVTDWTPLEISLVPIPADPGARIRADDPTTADEERRGMTTSAPEPETTGPPTDQPQAQRAAPVDPGATPAADAVRAAVEAERQRIAEIGDLGRRFALPAEIVDGLIASGASLEQARKTVLDTLAARSAQAVVYPTVATPVGGLDETQTRRDAVTSAIAHRALPEMHQITEPARQYRHATLFEIARELLEWSGVSTRGMSRFEIAHRAATSSDFPAILANVATASLKAGYQSIPRNWQEFCTQNTAMNLKEIYPTFFGDPPVLVKVTEGQEIPMAPLVEAKETYRLSKYAIGFQFTDELILNDELGALGRLPAGFGAAAAEVENSTVFGVLSGNPTMRDSKALFHVDHGNLASPGSTLTRTALDNAWVAMTSQTSLNNTTPIFNAPAFILVPQHLRFAASQIVAETTPSTTSDVTPDYLREMRVIWSPYLGRASSTAWYLAARPLLIHTIEYARLDSKETVQIETVRDTRTQTTLMTATHFFAAKALDWRGLYKNPGA